MTRRDARRARADTRPDGRHRLAVAAAHRRGRAGPLRADRPPIPARARGAVLRRHPRTATVGPFGQILDYGRARRLATPAQRRALAARDGGPHPRLRRPPGLVRRAPPDPLATRRPHRPAQSAAVVPQASHRSPRRHVGHRAPRRPALGHPTHLARPPTTPGPQPTPRHHRPSPPTRPTTTPRPRRHRIAEPSYSLTSATRFCRNRRSGSARASSRARWYSSRASAVRPRRRSRSARVEWKYW